MKNRFARARAVALALTFSSGLCSFARTNGVIFISTREPQDSTVSEYWSFNNGEPGPGMTSPGDVAMEALLQDYGYTCRLLLDRILGDTATAYCSTPPPRDTFLNPVKTNMAPALLICSGSSAGAAVPYPTQTNGIPMMMGEHTTISDRGSPGSIFMYGNGNTSTDPNGTAAPGGPTKYMKVLNPSHPIMQGIPLDSQGRVKIFREPYPEENAHLPIFTGSLDEIAPKVNYEYRWCTQFASNAAPGTTILGALDSNTNQVCFAVCDVGGMLSNSETSMVRLVHLFVNENGSGGSRRCFISLTDLAKVIFVRAAKWAMGETLEPYKGIGLIDISLVAPQQIQLSWQGAADRNYKIQATENLFGSYVDWQTVVQDIAGTNGLITRKLSLSNAPQYAFLRVAPMP